MLFRTVYSAELESIYQMITMNQRVSRKDIFETYVINSSKPTKNQNIDDALSFLVSAHLIVEENNNFFSQEEFDLPFSIIVLKNMRDIELGKKIAIHTYDHLYMHILSEVFIWNNQTYVSDLHQAANSLRKVIEIGGLSHEKIRAWTRVMEFLGVGRRAHGGFLCLINPILLQTIFQYWHQSDSTLQQFFEDYFYSILPYETRAGDLAKFISSTLLYLNTMSKITLSPMQDSPHKSYCHPFNFKRVRKVIA